MIPLPMDILYIRVHHEETIFKFCFIADNIDDLAQSI